MAKYNTNQRRELAAFLSQHPDELMTAQEISEQVDQSVSSVYRNLELLENEGKVTRQPKDGCREMLFRYMASEHCADMIHMCCSECGRTMHMNENTAKTLCDMLSSDGFGVDRTKTVIYGVCRDCGGNR